MTVTEILSLLGAAMAAGAINAVAGGGTILTFPTLLAVGTPPVIANATSTVALVIGTEAMVVNKDVLRIDSDEARRVSRWAIRALVEAAKKPA